MPPCGCRPRPRRSGRRQTAWPPLATPRCERDSADRSIRSSAPAPGWRASRRFAMTRWPSCRKWLGWALPATRRSPRPAAKPSHSIQPGIVPTARRSLSEIRPRPRTRRARVRVAPRSIRPWPPARSGPTVVGRESPVSAAALAPRHPPGRHRWLAAGLGATVFRFHGAETNRWRTGPCRSAAANRQASAGRRSGTRVGCARMN